MSRPRSRRDSAPGASATRPSPRPRSNRSATPASVLDAAFRADVPAAAAAPAIRGHRYLVGAAAARATAGDAEIHQRVGSGNGARQRRLVVGTDESVHHERVEHHPQRLGPRHRLGVAPAAQVLAGGAAHCQRTSVVQLDKQRAGIGRAAENERSGNSNSKYSPHAAATQRALSERSSRCSVSTTSRRSAAVRSPTGCDHQNVGSRRQRTAPAAPSRGLDGRAGRGPDPDPRHARMDASRRETGRGLWLPCQGIVTPVSSPAPVRSALSPQDRAPSPRSRA